ncbi:MAG: TIGR04211 family SH3 domain-containing protein [Sulfuricella sp.]|nr:TIGR04211 family SH3 domain-containing protein [Sulfuricella sp.]
MRVFLLITTLLWGGVAIAQTAQVVEASGVNMRSGKAENYRIVKVLPPNSEVKVLEADQDYTKVKTSEGETGWVLSKLLIIQKAVEEKTGQNKAELEAAHKELVASRVEVASLHRELERVNRAEPGSAPKPFSFILLAALGAFAVGVATGILILKAYYQKRLHGLRI